jgi:hypothetical protein
MKTHADSNSALYISIFTACLSLGPTQAVAACSYGEHGYVFTYQTCVTENRGRQSSPCYRDEGESAQRVLIISNVFADNDNRRDWPFKLFSRAYTRMYNGDTSGDVRTSLCYKSRSEAENKQEEMIDERLRDDVVVKQLHISE